MRSGVLTSSDVGSVVLSGVRNKRSPSTSNVQHPVALLQSELLTDHVELVVLELLEGLHTVDIGDDTGCVNHTWAKEPRIEVVSSVVVITDLVLILSLRVVDNLGNEVGEDVFEQLEMSTHNAHIVFKTLTSYVNSKEAQSCLYSITSKTSPLKSTFPSKYAS